MVCMSKQEAAALDIGDKVEILSYPEIVEAAEELDLITEEEKKNILSRYRETGRLAALVTSPTHAGFISSMESLLERTVTIEKKEIRYSGECQIGFTDEYCFYVKEDIWVLDRMMLRSKNEGENNIGDDEFAKLF